MNGKVNDLISRRQAIGALNDEYHGMISDESMKIYQIINWISALPSAQPETDINVGDNISRQQAIDKMQMFIDSLDKEATAYKSLSVAFNRCIIELKRIPSAQQERDIPVKPIETTDRAWGIPNRQAVCPKCDYYLGHVAFLGDYKGKRITYCETCGQAIDWEGWNFDE